MIDWILRELEKQPGCIFYEKELQARNAIEFTRLKKEKLLTYVQPHEHCHSYGLGRIKPLAVVKIGGQLYGIDDEDTEKDPVTLERADLIKYRFCLDRFANRLRVANDLSGEPFRLDRQQYYLGKKIVNKQRMAFVFGLFAGDKRSRSPLLSLPAQLGHRVDSIIVLTPFYEVGLADLSALLERAQIYVVPHRDTENWRVDVLAFATKVAAHFPTVKLTTEQEAEYDFHEYKCRLPVHLTGRITKTGNNEVLIGETPVEVGDVPFLLFLRLVLELHQNNSGTVSKSRLRNEGYFGEGTDDQSINRLRKCFVRALGDLDEKKFIEGYRPKTVRVSIHPDLVSWNTEKLLYHDHAKVRKLVQQLVHMSKPDSSLPS